jgi:hypothetical protein
MKAVTHKIPPSPGAVDDGGEHVGHRFTIEDGLIRAMEVCPVALARRLARCCGKVAAMATE